MCRKTSKRGSHFEKKKKKKIERGCHFGKKRIFWLVNTQEKDDEELSCDFEDDESKRESKEYAGIRERKNSFSFVRVLLSRVFSVLSAYK
jgi:hypothetical protein